MSPRLVDFYCCAGGAARGYQQAGFYVVGVDLYPQPRYAGDEFIQADALKLLADRDFLSQFDFIHASPPCQRYSKSVAQKNRANHPDLIAPTRELLRFVNVSGGWGEHDWETKQRAMGIDWMTPTELSEAIPPAYARYVGEQVLAALEAAA